MSRTLQADGQTPVSRGRAWRQAGGSEVEDHRLREHGAGLTCQFDVVPEALGSPGGSKPQQSCQTTPDQLALRASLETVYAAARVSWGHMPHGLPQTLNPSYSQPEAMLTGRLREVPISP